MVNTLVHKVSEINEGHILYLLDNWIIHATYSGYMDRDGFFKVVMMFAKFSGASTTNLRFLFQDGHDSHWDKDALNYVAEKDIHRLAIR